MPPGPDRPIVLVSNRGPLTFEVGADGSRRARRGAGGLVSGIGPLVVDQPDTVWLAAALTDGDRAAAADGVVEAEGFRVGMLSIDPETYRLAYDVVSNEALWFAHHGLWDLAVTPAFDSGWATAWEAYREVNRRFADAVVEAAPEGAAVLVQDYHLCLVAGLVARRRPDLACVHFSHTPFAPPAWLRVLPRASATELLEGMARHVACGFHTTRWAADYAAAAADLGVAAAPTFVSPLASDPDDVRGVAGGDACARALVDLEALLGDRTLLGRVDRVELSKNLRRGFLAFGDLLDRHPEHRGRVTFVAGAYPSRTGVPAYAAYRAATEAAVAEVNARHATADWTPIVLQVEDDHPRSVAVLRRADVLLVNPIRDGLNLVASEAALVNERDVVLALSPEAGAFERLHPGVLEVPPYDVHGTAEVLHRALTLPAEERRALAGRLRALAEARTPRHWLAEQLAATGPRP